MKIHFKKNPEVFKASGFFCFLIFIIMDFAQLMDWHQFLLVESEK